MSDETNLPKKRTLNEIMESSPGECFFEALIEAIPEETRNKLEFTDEELGKLKQLSSRLEHGAFTDIPITCCGSACPYEKNCDFIKMGKVPLGEKCPIEIACINIWTSRWISSLEIDIHDYTSIFLIRELVEAELMQARTNKYISNDGFIKKVIVSVDPLTNKESVNYDISVPLEVKLKFKTRIDKILQSLVATREERLKHKVDQSREVPAGVTELMKRIERGEVKIIEVDKKDE